MKICTTPGRWATQGIEDNGETSSWYVLSAMGLCHGVPRPPDLRHRQPHLRETRLTQSDGKVFTITARNVSATNKYIQSATLNGKPWNKPWSSTRTW